MVTVVKKPLDVYPFDLLLLVTSFFLVAGLPSANCSCYAPLTSVEVSGFYFNEQYGASGAIGIDLLTQDWFFIPNLYEDQPWILVNFNVYRTIIGFCVLENIDAGIVTIRNGTRYSLSYSDDGTTWTFLKEDQDSEVTMYFMEEHRDENVVEVREFIFPYAIVTKHLKINIDRRDPYLFSLYNIDVLQPEDSCGIKPMDLIFALESPATWLAHEFDMARDFAKDMVMELSFGLNDTLRIGFLTYGDQPDVLFDLNNTLDVDHMISTIDSITFVSSTQVETSDALQKVYTEMFTTQNGDRSYAANVLIVFTDGQNGGFDVSGWSQQLQDSGTSIFTVSITSNINTDTLGDITSMTDHQLAGNLPMIVHLFKLNFELHVEDLDFVHGDYVLSALLRDYSTAETYCRGLGGTLAAVNSSDDNNCLLQKADEYKDLCQQWWLGLHGQHENFTYWGDGSSVHFTNFSQIEDNGTEPVGTLLESDGNWLLSETYMQECSICQISPIAMDLILFSETHDIFIEEEIKFVMLLNSVIPDTVTLHFHNDYSCSVELNQTIDESTRTSLLSNFYLTDAHDGWMYKMIKLHFAKEGNFIISAESSSQSSIPQLITVRNGSVDEHSCLVSITVAGTGYAPQIATQYLKTAEITLSVNLGSLCAYLTSEITTWSIARRISQSMEACYEESDYEIITVNLDDIEVNDLNFMFKSDVLSVGNYQICFGVLFAQGIEEEYVDTLCGFITVNAEHPLVILISPNDTEIFHNSSTSLVLNASASFDPNSAENNTFSSSWKCSQSGGQCDFVPAVWPHIGSDDLQVPVLGKVLELSAGNLSEGQNYTITLSLEALYLQGASHTVNIYPREFQQMTLHLTCVSRCNETSQGDLEMHINCVNCQNAVISVNIHIPGYGQVENTSAMIAFLPDNSGFIIDENFLNPFLEYSLTVTADKSWTIVEKTYTVVKQQDTCLFLTYREAEYSSENGSYNYYTFLILLNETDSMSVSVNVGHKYNCSQDLNILDSEPDALFSLFTFPRNITDTENMSDLMFAVFDVFHWQTNTALNVTVTSPEGCSSHINMSPVNVSEESWYHCAQTMQIEGVSANIYTATPHQSSEVFNSVPTYSDSSCTNDYNNASRGIQKFHYMAYSMDQCLKEMDFLADYANDTTTINSQVGYHRICWLYDYGLSARHKICGFVKIVGSVVLSVHPNATELLHERIHTLRLNASESDIPDDWPSKIELRWICEQNNGQCDFVSKKWPAVSADTKDIPFTDVILEVEGSYLTEGATYIITLVVVQEEIFFTNHTVNITIPQPELHLLCVSRCNETSQGDLEMHINCVHCQNAVISVNIHIPGYGQVENTSTMIAFLPDNSGFIIDENFLNPFLEYSLTVTADKSGTIVEKTYTVVKQQDTCLFLTYREAEYSSENGSYNYYTFLILLNETDSMSVSVNVGHKYNCSQDLNILDSEPDALFSLFTFPRNITDTENMSDLMFAVFDVFHWQTNTALNVTVTSPEGCSSHINMSPVNVSEESWYQCAQTMQIDGVSANIYTATPHQSSEVFNSVPTYSDSSCTNDYNNASRGIQKFHYMVDSMDQCLKEMDFLADYANDTTTINSQVGYHRICWLYDYGLSAWHKICGYVKIVGSVVLSVHPNATELLHERIHTLRLNASESDIPDDWPSKTELRWICEQNNGQCDFVSKKWPAVSADTKDIPFTDVILEVEGSYLTEGATYIITLVVVQEEIFFTNHTVNITIPQPELHLFCTSGCEDSYMQSDSVQIDTNCSHCYGINYIWKISVDDGDFLELPNSLWTNLTDYNNTSVHLPAGYFNPLKSYNISATFTDGRVSSSVLIPEKGFKLILRADYHDISINDYDLFLVIVNATSESYLQIKLTNTFTCTPDLSVITASDRSKYPLTDFFVPASTDGMKYTVLSYQFLDVGLHNITASMNLDSEILTSTDYFFVHNEDDHHCLTHLQIEGTAATMSEAKVYTRSHHLHFTSSYGGSCDDVIIISYNWTAYHYQGDNPTKCTFKDELEQVVVPTSNTEHGYSFHIPAKTLPLGYNRLCLDMIFISESTEQHKNKGCGYILMKADPLVAALSPSVTYLTLPSSQPLLLDASNSYNPNSDDQSNIGFSWKCVQDTGKCNFVDSIWPGQNIQDNLPVTDPVLSLTAGSLTIGQTYKFTLTITKLDLPASSVEITVLSSNPTTPSLIISCVFGCGQKLNPSERLALSAECSNCGETGLSVQSYSWSITSNFTNSQLSDEEVVATSTTGVSRSTLVLSAYFFNASDVYSITVTGTNSYSERGSAMYVVPINSPPVPGTCSITPPSGQALTSHFTVMCTGFQDPDSPLVYKVFRDRQNSSSQLLKSGLQSTISHLTLPTGPAHTNYTHNITVSVFDAYATSTSLSLTVQVLNPVSTNQSISKTVRDLVQNFTVKSVSEQDSPDFLGFASNVADILNDEAISDITNDSVVQRSEARETILTTLGTVEVDSQDVLQQMTDIIGDLTSETAAVTENIQDLAVNVSSQLTESLGSVAESAPTVAKTIAVKQLSTLENLIELTMAAKPKPEPSPDEPAPSVPTKTVEEKTKPILELYEKIGDAMLKGLQFADEEPLKIEAKKTSLALAWSPADREEDVEISSSLSSGDAEGTFQISLRKSLENIGSNSIQAVNFQVQVMSENPYTWDDSASDVNMPVVNVVMKSRDENTQKLQLANLTEPAGIHIATNMSLLPQWTDSEMNATYETLNVTLQDDQIFASETKLLRLTANQSSMIRIRTIDVPLSIQIHYISNDNITVAQLREVGEEFPRPLSSRQTYGENTQDPDIIILPKLAGNESFYTLGFTLKTGQSYDSGGLNETLIMVCVETYTIECSYWKEDTEEWDTQGCQVSLFTTMERLFCQCDHLTAFSGGFFVAPNTIDPIGDIALFLTFFENPVVVTAVLAVWGVYLLLLYWARQNDKEDAMKVGMTVLRDNDPKDKYVYLICAVTSWWPQAGTSANVFIYLRSKYKQSARHMLADPQRKLFTKGSENWFVLTTSEKLGKIKSVVVWHDNKGNNPSWYLKEIVVHDIQTKEVWHCLYDDWLAVDSSHGLIQAEIPSLVNADIVKHRLYQFSLKSSQDFRNSHLWISIFSKPAYSEFTRAQRLTCGLSLLLTSMLSSLMFLGIPTDDPDDQVQKEGLVLSLSAIAIGVQSGLLMFPINTIIIQLFMRTAHKVSPEKSEVLFSTSSNLINVSELSKAKGNGKSSLQSLTTDSGVKVSNSGLNVKKSDLSYKRESKVRFAENDEDIRVDGRKSSLQSLTTDSGVKVNNSGLNVKKSDLSFKRESKVSFAENDEDIRVDEIDIAMSRGDIGDNQSQQKLKDEKKAKAKKPFKLPWWFMYISWSIALSTCVICSYFVMLYGLKYGYQRSLDWLVSFFTCFFQSALVTQPIKVLVVAILLTQILRRPVQYDSWQLNQEIEEDEVEKMTVKHGGSVQNRYYVPPLSMTMLEKIRKRINMDGRSRFILYEILLYFTFVAVVLLMIYGHRNIDMTYRVTKATENMFTEEDTGFGEVDTAESMWEYLGDHFVSNLLSDDTGSGLTSCQASYVIGRARLRQLRIRHGLCSPPEGMDIYSRVGCTGSYWITDEDTTSYNGTWNQTADSIPSNITEYTYQSAYKLLTLPFIGKLATYSGGGYVKELSKIPNDAKTALSNLQNSDWIDQYTRAVFVEFSLYNPNVNLFSVVVLVFECTNLGKIFPYYQIFTTNLYHYSGSFHIFVAVCEAMFVVYLIAFTYLEVSKFRGMTAKEYFSDVWSYIEVIILAQSYTVFGLFIQRMVSINYSLKLYKESKGESFVSFHPALSSDVVLHYVMASLSIFIIIKFFKLLRFNVRMSLLSGTLKRCKGLLFQYFIKVFLYTMAFTTFAVVVFGPHILEYSNFGESIITLFNFALGASDYFGLEEGSRSLGPLFFFTFSVLYQFLLIMIFCTIIIDAYKSMVEHIMTLKTEVHMVDFILKRVKLLTMTDKKKKIKFRKEMYQINTDY